MYTFTFNGIKSSVYNVYITSGSSLAIPARDITLVSIPGRDGNLILDNGGYKNITVSYGCIMLPGASYTLAKQLERMKEWLYSSFTYHMLYDDYDSGYYREAVFTDGISDVTVRIDTAFFTVKFSCKPARTARTAI